jgi:hypothetical protein
VDVHPPFGSISFVNPGTDPLRCDGGALVTQVLGSKLLTLAFVTRSVMAGDQNV